MRFLARSADGWRLSSLEAGDPAPLRLDAVLALVGPGPAPAAPGLAPDGIVAPAWLLVGALEDGAWVVHDAEGRPVRCDADDLRLLDALRDRTSVGIVAGRSGVRSDVAGSRLGRLADHGLVRTGPLADVPGPIPAEAPAERGSPILADPSPDPGDGRVPVYAIWHPEVGPLLSLGMLTAAARHHDGGALDDRYEIRRPEPAATFLRDVARRRGPAVLLCSDYVWSVELNLAAAREAVRLNPQLVVVHGGPSSPRYEQDAERFLTEHAEVAHVLTRGEGERTVCELLEALHPDLPRLDTGRLSAVPGLTFRDPATGAFVRTEERERIADLDSLPSPYLTGEFDHIAPDAWSTCLSIETNRGCPYGCTFCDWGSSILSRIRMFDLDRVTAELQWAAHHGIASINLADANFGIMSRDVETASRLADIRRQTGFPKLVSFYPAKNTTKHLSRITDLMVDVGIGTAASISLQSSDPDVLEAIDRSNIATDHYVALAADYRRRGLPLQGDLLLGLPGQTYDSYRADLQFNLDHEIMTRTWQTHVLPNAPMNDPAYRERFAMEVERDRVMSTSTFTRADRERMLHIRDVEIVLERFGVLRHVLRWLQWDHGLGAMDVMEELRARTDAAPDDLPHLSWLLASFRRFPTAPVGWAPVYEDARRFVRDGLGVAEGPAFEVTFALQQFLMPWPGRTFPAALALAHDYVAYYRDATATLYTTGHAGRPPRPLEAYGPGRLVVAGDPLQLCVTGVAFAEFGTDEMEGDFEIGANSGYELLSPLTRLLPHVTASGVTPADLGPDAPLAPQHLGPAPPPRTRQVTPIRLATRPSG